MTSLSPDNWHARKFLDRDFTDEAVVEFSKDYDRLLYSTAFRRLGGVTQVVASNEIALFHTRLTHSLKTAQVGTRLTNHLRSTHNGPRWDKVIKEYGGLEQRVVRAACLAHDLGHPPFGHIAEAELQFITSRTPNRVRPRRPDGGGAIKLHPEVSDGYDLRDQFEGNAQSFRIVTKLAFREPPEKPDECPAINLTRGTLAAMLKYPWAKDQLPNGVDRATKKNKWGFYDSESEIWRWVFDDNGGPRARKVSQRDRKWEHRTLEAQVMDWADDISYAVHDAEDFFRAGIIPLDRLAVLPNEWEEFFAYAWNNKLSKLFPNDQRTVKEWGEDVVFRLFPQVSYSGSGGDRINLHKFASTLISDVTKGTRLESTGAVVADDKSIAVIELLKQLTWYYVIDRPSLESVQRGQRRLIRSLYCNLIEWVEQVWEGPEVTVMGNRRELPARLLEYLQISHLYDPPPEGDEAHDIGNKRISRAVIDYIVSLTEGQTIALNARLTGQSAGSMLDSWSHI